MEKEIMLAGLSASPSGHLCDDGRLAVCVGAAPKDGGLVAASMPKDKYALPGGYELACVHVTPQGARLIAKKAGGAGEAMLYWCVAVDDREIDEGGMAFIEEFDSVRSVAAYGQLLVIAASDGLGYAHWTASGYAMLDLRNPPIVEFGLQKAGALSMAKQYAVPAWMAGSNPNLGYGQGAWATHPLAAEKASDAQSAAKRIFSDFRQAVEGQIEAAGYFHSPFFVRYALRLHDGSHILPSPPVLMLPSLLPPMLKAAASATADGDEAVLTIDASGMNYFSLRYRVSNFLPKNLGPYVAAIDVFVTESVPTFADDETTGGIVSYSTIVGNRNLFNSTDRGRASGTRIFAGQWSVADDDYSDHYVDDSDLSKDVWNISPNLSMAAAMLELSEFRLVGSIPVSDAGGCGDFQNLGICCSSSAAINNLPLLDADEADLARRICPGLLWSDGNTLMAAGGEMSLQKPWPLVCGIAFHGNGQDPAYLPVTLTCYSRSLADDGYSSITSSSAYSPRYSLAASFPHYLYVSDPGAYKLEIRQGGNAWSLPMRRHPALPGAFWIGDLERAIPPAAQSLPQLYNMDTSPAKTANRLYVSAKSKPFHFAIRGEAGEGTIRFMAPAFRSMSSGQFGEYPLYVFTSAGIWVVPISLASAPVRISEVAATSIAMVGADVAYASSSGVFFLSGTKSECVSAHMHGDGDKWLLQSEGVKGLLQAEGVALPMPSFGDALENGVLHYDSSRNALYLKSESGDVAYAYSCSDKCWGMASGSGKAFVLTRPMKLGQALDRKAIKAAMLAGPLSQDATKIAVLGSDDLKHWRTMASAKGTAITAICGTGARYISVAISATLAECEALSGINLMID